jgi:hypothetical protein
MMSNIQTTDGATMIKRDIPKKLTLKRETLRRLTPTELRLVAGGYAWTASRDTYTLYCPR